MPRLQTQQAHLAALLKRDTIRVGHLIILAVGLAVLILIIASYRSDNILMTLELCLLVPAVALPAAIPAVLSVTMTAGEGVLARNKAVDTRLLMLEDPAGADIFCSDKTCTLNQDELLLSDPFTINHVPPDQAVLYAALALQAKAAIARARQMGVNSKMAIACNIQSGSGLDLRIFKDTWFDGAEQLAALDADRFERTFPSHKYYVDLLQTRDGDDSGASAPQKANSGGKDALRAIA